MDPSNFEMIIDNDSGTYRPNAKLLPLLREFISTNFPGLSVITLDCQGDAELMARLKNEQREKKRREGKTMVYMQASRTDSMSSSESDLSSSEEERLDSLAAAQEEEDHGKKSGGAHKFGEAVAPFLGDHERLRKAVGAPSKS